eukprot:TRINITY_DN2056_c0_g1_i2.p1 TRINITY_DN2056_c0_g1~~TRINITY_DN2056_c0_g1_i2.p1  ORF type:complete len:156 (+),score=1.13 TRINITY_DN2056_c0_g1_i2:44-469(+)
MKSKILFQKWKRTTSKMVYFNQPNLYLQIKQRQKRGHKIKKIRSTYQAKIKENQNEILSISKMEKNYIQNGLLQPTKLIPTNQATLKERAQTTQNKRCQNVQHILSSTFAVMQKAIGQEINKRRRKNHIKKIRSTYQACMY